MKISRKNLNILIEKFLREEEEPSSSEPEAEPTETKEEPAEDESDESGQEAVSENKREDFEFAIRIMGVLIRVRVNYNEKGIPVPTIISDDDRVSKLIAKAKPIHYLTLAFEKMKELEGYEDEERKSMFNKIAFFLKDYDMSIESENAENIFTKLKTKHFSYIKYALNFIEKLLSQ